MALTITEANAVNTLLSWLLDIPGEATPSSRDAQHAAELLADHAHKTLHAGLSGGDVTQSWPQEVPF